jgi:K+-sensing histidine kinase KdpD
MKPSPSTQPATLEYTKMLFLVSHGLQTPLSAIRWGCGRLKKTGSNLTTDQMALVDGVQQQTRVLSSMFDMLLLLAKVEEGVHISTLQQLYLSEFLESPDRQKNNPREFTVAVTCPDSCVVKVDRVIFASIIDALFLVLSLSSAEDAIPIDVRVEDTTCVMTFTAPMQLSVLEESVESLPGVPKNRIVGGIPGFLLAVASSLLQSMDGTLESSHEETPRTLTLRLPIEPVLSLDV